MTVEFFAVAGNLLQRYVIYQRRLRLESREGTPIIAAIYIPLKLLASC